MIEALEIIEELKKEISKKEFRIRELKEAMSKYETYAINYPMWLTTATYIKYKNELAIINGYCDGLEQAINNIKEKDEYIEKVFSESLKI